MKKEALATLLGYFQDQRKTITVLHRSLGQAALDNVEKTAYVGYVLHNLYCAVEQVFQQIAGVFENTIPDMSKYHRELLKRMHIDIPGFRPRLLSDDSFTLLDELRRFRHVFRHSYEFDLSSQLVGDLRNKVLTGWNTVEKDFDVFTSFLADELRR